MSYQTRRNNPFGQQQNVGNVGQRRPVVTHNFLSGTPNRQGGPQTRGGLQPGNADGQFRNQHLHQQSQNQKHQQQQHTPIKTQQHQQQTPVKTQQQTPAKPQQQQQVVPPQQQQQQTPAKPQQQPKVVPPQQQQQQPAKAQQQPAKPQQQVAQTQQQVAQTQQQVAQTQQQVTPPQQVAPTQQETAPPQQQPLPQPAPAVEVQQNEVLEDVKEESMNEGREQEAGEEQGTEQPKKKTFWLKTKISKKERLRRRNIRLSRVLQPKNAVMVLHELVRNTTFEVTGNNNRFSNENQFKATVVVDGVEHVGFGRNKAHAKNAAAEIALKYYVKHNKLSEVKTDENGGEKMEIEEESADAAEPWPWSQVASFALYKLYTSWGEDPNKAAKAPQPSGQQPQQQQQNTDPQKVELRPSKKLPDHPETYNPVLLINQMLPHARFDEIGMSGMPPTVTFSFKCIVDDKSFLGTGSSKKAAKKMAAFGACHTLLGINYPSDVYTPNN